VPANSTAGLRWERLTSNVWFEGISIFPRNRSWSDRQAWKGMGTGKTLGREWTKPDVGYWDRHSALGKRLSRFIARVPGVSQEHLRKRSVSVSQQNSCPLQHRRSVANRTQRFAGGLGWDRSNVGVIVEQRKLNCTSLTGRRVQHDST